jgi:hypothetical protein
LIFAVAAVGMSLASLRGRIKRKKQNLKNDGKKNFLTSTAPKWLLGHTEKSKTKTFAYEPRFYL